MSSTPSSQHVDDGSSKPTDSVDPNQSDASQPSSLPDEVIGPSSKLQRKLKSMVWNHFEKMVVNGEDMAKCMHCKKIFTAGSKNGTSHLKDHLNKRCIRKVLNLDVRQQLLKQNSMSDGKARLEGFVFDQEVSRNELVNMVAMHEYPMSMVDHIGFRRFIASLNPSFKFISRNTLKSDILKVFNSQKASLKKAFELLGGRIAITTDMWTASHQKKGYMVVTVHYIDEKWVLHNRTLRFAYVPSPHTAENLSKALVDTFNMYNIAEKVSSVVVDNCNTNDAMLEVLRKKIDKDSLLMDGRFLHMRCSAHILNLIVQDGLDVIGKGIETIRNCVSIWLASPKRIEIVEEKARACKIDCSKRMVLDCKTRWNSTYLMLKSALPYREVFSKLKTRNENVKFVVPSDEDWKFAHIVCEKLEVFYNVTLLFSGRKFPTVNLFFKHICEIKLDLESWISSDEQKVKNMAQIMLLKFDKYWSSINEILAVAAVLDPRNKLACVEFYFNEIYGDLGEIEMETIKAILHDLMNEHRDVSSSRSDDYNSLSGKRQRKASMGSENISSGGRATRWDLVSSTKNKKSMMSTKAELELYLENPVIPPSDVFDVLHYWKNCEKFPTLAKLAKNILAIPASTVASKSAFSSGGRLVSAHRSKLRSDTVEALSCMQNWIIDDFAGLSITNHQAIGTCTDDEEESKDGNPIDSDVLYDDKFLIKR